MKRIIIPLLALVLIGAAIGFYLYNKPVASLDNKKPDVVVTADEILADYESDEQAANDKYLGKVVEVSGKVSEVSTEGEKNKVTFETSNPISLVITELDEGNSVEGIEPGEHATVKGMCSGYLSDVILVRATVMK